VATRRDLVPTCRNPGSRLFPPSNLSLSLFLSFCLFFRVLACMPSCSVGWSSCHKSPNLLSFAAIGLHGHGVYCSHYSPQHLRRVFRILFVYYSPCFYVRALVCSVCMFRFEVSYLPLRFLLYCAKIFLPTTLLFPGFPCLV
jgi:hypothetical protein